MKDHPIAGLFPLLAPTELNELAESIQRSGQRDDIVLFEGLILDGRNRFRACEIAKVKPRTRVFDPKTDGPSPLRFVLDLNLSRRHLTTSQRAAIAAEALKLRETMAKQAARTVGSQIGRQVVRGLLGSLLGGRRRR
jgi:ParB-like chromosome segregation protein Spo0J